MELIRRLLPYVNFYLMHTTLQHILGSFENLEHKPIKILNYLIIATYVYELWKKMNKRFHHRKETNVTILVLKIQEL